MSTKTTAPLTRTQRPPSPRKGWTFPHVSTTRSSVHLLMRTDVEEEAESSETDDEGVPAVSLEDDPEVADDRHRAHSFEPTAECMVSENGS